MALVKDLINQAYSQIRVIDDGDEADGVDAAVGVTLLNQILAQANSDQLFPFLQTILSYPIMVSSNTLTIGAGTPTANVVGVRPEIVSRILYTAPAATQGVQLRRMELSDLFARSKTTAGDPTCFAYNPGYPNGSLIFDRPLVSGTGTLTIIYIQGLSAVTISSDLTTVPPKYDDFLVCSLARRLAVRKMRPPEVVANADSLYNSAKEYILSSNGKLVVPTNPDFAVAKQVPGRSGFGDRTSYKEQ